MSKVNEVGLLLSNPAHRCRYTFARDSRGEPRGARSTEAAQWCLVGAISKVGGDLYLETKIHKILHAAGSLSSLWDNATDDEQDKIADKLKNHRSWRYWK